MPSQNISQTRCIILVHGMWMNAFMMKFIGHRLCKKGWRVIYFQYSSMFQNFDESVEQLYKFWKANQSENTHLVGHSLGGLLILALMKKYDLQELPRTVLMGCPVNGSAVARRMMSSRFGSVLLGKSAQVLMKGISDARSNKIGLILGSKGFGIGHLIQSLPEPHDGVVAVTEANMLSAEDKVIIPTTHAMMLVSGKTVNAIDQYLSGGRF